MHLLPEQAKENTSNEQNSSVKTKFMVIIFKFSSLTSLKDFTKGSNKCARTHMMQIGQNGNKYFEYFEQ